MEVPQLIEQTTSYVIQLKEKVNYLREKKMTLLGEMGKHSDGSSSSLLPKLSIYSRDSTIQMNLVMDPNMKSVRLHQLLSVFKEEGAQVMNANIQKLNDRMIIYTIIAQAIIYRIGIDPSRIEERVPYVVKLNPDDDKQNVLLAGMSDKKIVQCDVNTWEITQEYDQHLGAVNTVTFVDNNNRRIVTSSDDKSLRVWEFGIPVVIKYISELHMHSMPAISVHPNGNWLGTEFGDSDLWY
ncbi:hypothetical protein Bca52824_076079 [Brassica carinata]|uniref:Transcription factor WD40-like family n=1 Tax=Brassica carinata TaxID=52824 RepID=A0A8X7TW07_BRACI|nr:hypothetical protein Bca52824_076079 [Brassica carinata]